MTAAVPSSSSGGSATPQEQSAEAQPAAPAPSSPAPSLGQRLAPTAFAILVCFFSSLIFLDAVSAEVVDRTTAEVALKWVHSVFVRVFQYALVNEPLFVYLVANNNKAFFDSRL